MEKKSTQVMDIVIFGVCLFAILLLIEYRQEAGRNVLLGAGTPLALIGLFFGFRGANAHKVNENKRDSDK